MPIRPTRSATLAALAAAATLAAPAVRPAAAQGGTPNAGCAAREIYLRDACQKGVDVFNLLAPQLGTSLAGGNAVLGQAGTLGGPGRFTLGLRVNALRGAVPVAENVTLSVTGAQATDLGAQEQALGLPTAEAALGVFGGVQAGATRVGGIDAIVSGTYIPDFDVDRVSVFTTGGAFKLGYGVRLGILEETPVVPGVSVTWLRRTLPTVSVITRTGSDTVAVNDIDATTTAWRLVAGKRLGIVALAAGAGRDTYEAAASAGAVINRTIPGLGSARVEAFDITRPTQELSRTNVFGDVTLHLSSVRLVGEVGRVSGGEVAAPYNGFDGRTGGEAYTYGSLGLRVQF